MIYLSLNVFKSEARTLPGAKGSRPSGRRLLYGSTISHLGGKEGNPANISSWMCNIKMISISVNIQYPQIFNIHQNKSDHLADIFIPDCALYNRQFHPDYPDYLQNIVLLDYPLRISLALLDDPNLWRKNVKLYHPFATDRLIQMIRIICK